MSPHEARLSVWHQEAVAECEKLRAQLAAVTRERNGLRDELEARNTALRECEALREAATRMLRGEMLARCDAESRLEAVTRERDGLAQTNSSIARESVMVAVRIAALERERDEARADAARLWAALASMLCKPEPGQAAPCPCRRCGIARAALASTPSDEPTPRDMRVAEAVREACFGIADFGAGGREGVMESLRDLNLAAVVAKVVGA